MADQIQVPGGLCVIPTKNPAKVRACHSRWSGRTRASEICKKILLPTDPNGCWLQKNALNDKGYARWSVLGRTVYGHRAVYEMFNGPIPEGKVLDHLCRNTACVNPDHVEVVTQSENMRRSVPRCSKLTHCKHGHELSGDNVYIWKKRFKRVCRTCIRENMRRYRCRNQSR